MRIAYGFGRSNAAFSGLKVDRVYLDGASTNRSERRGLFRDLREGDTLVLLRVSDLGAGKGLRNMRNELAARGVDIEIADPEPVESKPMGRPRKVQWDQSTVDRFAALWADVSVDGAYIIDQACGEMGEDPKDRKARERVRQRLLRMFNKRG